MCGFDADGLVILGSSTFFKPKQEFCKFCFAMRGGSGFSKMDKPSVKTGEFSVNLMEKWNDCVKLGF